MWIILLFLVQVYADGPPASPCPDIYKYETDSDILKGVITIRTPAKYPKVQLSLKAVLAFPDVLDRYELPGMSIDGKEMTISTAGDQIPDGEKGFIEYYVNFVPNKPVPTLVSLTMNGEELCGPQQDPPDWRLKVFLDYNFKGNSVPVEETRFLRSEVRKFSPGNPPLPAVNKPSPGPVVYSDFEVDFSYCGVPGELPSPLVVSGVQANRAEWPWQVAIFKKERTSLSFVFQCGGTLVTRRHVVTAAHCMVDRTPSSVSLVLGKNNIANLYEEGQQGAEVNRIIIHPDYDVTNYKNDISLIVLKNAVRVSTYVRPACLWDGLPTGQREVEGQVASVPGWGHDETGYLSETLKVANVLIVSREKCVDSDRIGAFYLRFTNNRTLCAGFRNGTGPCNGDSGGGLFMNMENSQQGRNTWFLRGIVSISKADLRGKCDVNNYHIFTDAAMFSGWLKGLILQSR